MHVKALRPRVERLLSGPFVPDDLTRVFLGLRFRAGDKRLFREVADFVAHQGDRDKGPASERTEDFFRVARYQMPRLASPASDSLQKLPATAEDAFHSMVKLMGYDLITTRTGLKRGEVKDRCKQIGKKFSKNADGTLRIDAPIERAHLRILDETLTFIGPPPAWDSEKLFNEFCAVLIANGVMDVAHKKDAQHLHDPLALYAVQAMHNCEMALSDGSKGFLTAGAGSPRSGEEPRVMVIASVPANANGVDFKVAFPLFETSVLASSGCEAQLASSLQGSMWEGLPLDLNANGKLSIVGV